MNFRTIHFRLIRWYSGITVLVSVAFGAYVDFGTYRSLYDGLDRVLSRRARNISNHVLPSSVRKPVSEFVLEMDALYAPEANGWFIRIFNPDGSLYYVSGAPNDGRFDPLAVPIGNEKNPRRRMVRLNPLVKMLVVSEPSEIDGRTFRVEMGMPTDGVDEVLDGLVKMLLFGVPAITGLVSLGGYLLVRRALQPVEAIRAKAEKITFGNLSDRLPVSDSGDELENLSVTLNQMLGRLEEAYLQSSRFSADASHELRTPLTILLGELESIIQEPGLDKGIKDRLGSVYEETERLSRIVESLFAISRLDSGEAKMTFVRLDLATLARSTAEQMSVLAEEKKISVHINVVVPTYVNGNPGRLKQVVVNLMDNAIKYTPEKGNIRVDVYHSGDDAVLEVADDGIGIPADSLPHVFERFFRADKVRTREIGGAGIGLSIVKSICQAHMGNVEIKSAERGGTVCRVKLRLAEKESGEG